MLPLVRAGGFDWDRRLRRNLPIVVFAALAMGAALWYALPHLAPHLAYEAALWERIAALAALVAGGGGLFFAIVTATGVLRLSMIRRA